MQDREGGAYDGNNIEDMSSSEEGMRSMIVGERISGCNNMIDLLSGVAKRI